MKESNIPKGAVIIICYTEVVDGCVDQACLVYRKEGCSVSTVLGQVHLLKYRGYSNPNNEQYVEALEAIQGLKVNEVYVPKSFTSPACICGVVLGCHGLSGDDDDYAGPEDKDGEDWCSYGVFSKGHPMLKLLQEAGITVFEVSPKAIRIM